MRKLQIILVIVCIIASYNLQAQMAVNTDGSSANASAMLDIKSTTKGFLAPRMTEAQKNAISTPAAGLMVYQTDGTTGYYYYSGSAWTQVGIGTGSSQWTTTGNDIYYNTGNVGIGATTPGAKLHIAAGAGGAALKIDNTASIELGAGLTKEANAGKIGYQLFSTDALDIVGAGTIDQNRKIQFFAEGGTTFTGAVAASGAITTSGAITASVFRGIGDTDGGMYSSADGTLNFATDNAERLRITTHLFSNGYSFLSGDNDGGIFSPEDGVVTFLTNNAERMRLDGSGNLAIGTTTAASKLHVNGAARLGSGSRLTLPASDNANMWNIDNAGGNLRFFREDFSATGAGANGSAKLEMGNDGSLYHTGSFTNTGNVGINTAPESTFGLVVKGVGIEWPFKTYNATSIEGQWWKFGPSSNGTNDFYLTAHTGAGAYLNDDGVGGWQYTSDIRLKENIKPIDSALEKVLKLRGVNFNFIGRDFVEIGVIAQEVQAQFPELVSENIDGYLSVGYDRLGPVLIEAIKEQQKQIEALKTEIENLKNR